MFLSSETSRLPSYDNYSFETYDLLREFWEHASPLVELVYTFLKIELNKKFKKQFPPNIRKIYFSHSLAYQYGYPVALDLHDVGQINSQACSSQSKNGVLVQIWVLLRHYIKSKFYSKAMICHIDIETSPVVANWRLFKLWSLGWRWCANLKSNFYIGIYKETFKNH